MFTCWKRLYIKFEQENPLYQTVNETFICHRYIFPSLISQIRRKKKKKRKKIRGRDNKM